MPQLVAKETTTDKRADHRPKILVVDDDASNSELLGDMVESCGFEAELARDGLEALAKLRLDIDLVLLDLMMPGMDGFDVTRQIRSDEHYRHIPVIVVTSYEDRAHRLAAIEAGANDFITKPVDPTELRIRTASLLRLKEAYDAVHLHTTHLEELVKQQTVELRKALVSMAGAQRDIYRAHLDTIQRLALAAEYKDECTAAHIRRMSMYSVVLARTLGLPPDDIELLRYGSIMHDVGKIGIPDAILLKPGKLTPAEWRIMKSHTQIGARILSGSPSELMQAGEIIARSHHEWWDGSGYPHGLAGEDIPLWGRICAVADVFDALTARRPYKLAMPNEKALQIIRDEVGTHFDPRVTEAFFDSLDEILGIQAETPDESDHPSLILGEGGDASE